MERYVRQSLRRTVAPHYGISMILSNLESNSHFPTRVSSLVLIAAKNTGKRIVLWRRSVGSEKNLLN